MNGKMKKQMLKAVESSKAKHKRSAEDEGDDPRKNRRKGTARVHAGTDKDEDGGRGPKTQPPLGR